MIVDTSVLISILKNEPDAPHFERKLEDTLAPLRMSAASYVEAGIVTDGSKDETLSAMLDAFLQKSGIEIIPVSESQARTARRAYQQFGKGSGHPAQLNFGDCFAYALSWESGEPLLFKGDDFIHTDIEAVS